MKTVIFVLALSSAAAAQVTGAVSYEDKTYTTAGFTLPPYPFQPVRQAEVEIIRLSDGTVLGSGVTDNGGLFSVAGVPPAETVFARIYARRSGGKIRAVVKDNPSSGAVYTAISTTITTTGGLDPIPAVALTIPGGAAGVFNIFDAAVKSFEYQASVDTDLPDMPPLLTIYWEAGSSEGTYFTRTTNSVFLLGLSSDPDEFDDDIILHEIGHWVAFNFSIDDTLGGPHSVTDQLDARTAWSEGWAHYWSSAVRLHFPSEYASPSSQVDNFTMTNSLFDLEGPSFSATAVMATNELAVAAVLWDIIDAANEGPFDMLTGNQAAVWRAVNDQIPSMVRITLEDFREGLALEAAGIMSDVTGSEAAPGIMKDRGIRYYLDGSESNNDVGSAAPLTVGAAGLLQRTFFATGDQDWFVISIGAPGGTLVAETSNLGDGANTRLELYASDGTTLLDANDDRAPGDLSSRAQFSVAAAGTYYVRVLRMGNVIENGYYDLRAQIVFNLPPVLVPVTASITIGTAPLRVTFTGDATDPEAHALEYRWDFDGDGRVDWISQQGGTVTTTYLRPGTFNATLRVVDSDAAESTSNVAVTVIPTAAPTINVTQSLGSGTAPLVVNFGAVLSGLVPSSYEWDFDSDGIIDHVSVTSPAVSFTYRRPASYVARLTVTDAQGRAYRALSGTVTVSPGVSPPTVSAFSATSGAIPFASTFTVSHADPGGAVTNVEFDFDGDGRFDLDIPPTSPASTTVNYEVHRLGSFTARVRVTDNSGLSAQTTATYVSIGPDVRGWLVDPRAGDRLAGNAITLSAEAVPSGQVKKVVFQVRPSAPPGAWTDVGAPLLSEGTLFTTSWDISSLPALSTFDLRILVDDTASSGDTANPVTIDPSAPTLREENGVREKTAPPRRTTVSRNAAGVWVVIPAGSMAATTDRLLRLSPASTPGANGSALGMTPRGQACRVDVNATFNNAFSLRMPSAGNGEAFEIHAYDEFAGLWYRPGPSQVSSADGWVESQGIATGTYAVFDASALKASSAASIESDSCTASSSAGTVPAAWLGILASGMGLWACRRRR